MASSSGQHLSFFDFNTPLAAGEFYESPPVDVSLYESLSFIALTDQETSVMGFWKNDPSDSDRILAFDLTYDPATSTNGFSATTEVKGVYFTYLIGNTSATDQTIMNVSCYVSSSPPSPPSCSLTLLTTLANNTSSTTLPIELYYTTILPYFDSITTEGSLDYNTESFENISSKTVNIFIQSRYELAGTNTQIRYGASTINTTNTSDVYGGMISLAPGERIYVEYISNSTRTLAAGSTISFFEYTC